MAPHIAAHYARCPAVNDIDDHIAVVVDIEPAYSLASRIAEPERQDALGRRPTTHDIVICASACLNRRQTNFFRSGDILLYPIPATIVRHYVIIRIILIECDIPSGALRLIDYLVVEYDAGKAAILI